MRLECQPSHRRTGKRPPWESQAILFLFFFHAAWLSIPGIGPATQDTFTAIGYKNHTPEAKWKSFLKDPKDAWKEHVKDQLRKAGIHVANALTGDAKHLLDAEVSM